MKKWKTMDIILVGLAIFLLIFVLIMLIMYYLTGGIPDTLCTCVFGICGGECGVMGWIRTTKDKAKDREWTMEDRKADVTDINVGSKDNPLDSAESEAIRKADVTCMNPEKMQVNPLDSAESEVMG